MIHPLPSAALSKPQRGRFLQGMLIGLLIGLALAVGITRYINKTPSPFVNKVPHRTAIEDDAEAQKNRHWNPNDPLIQGRPTKPTGNTASSFPPPGVVLPPPEQAVVVPATSSSPGSETEVSSSGGNQEIGTFFVQAGAFSRQEDAEQQRARLAMINLEAKVSEKVQSGRTIYRVRLGPFEKKADADAAKIQIESEGMDASLFKAQSAY
jgi:cell division protein FtsN